ncbi:ROK family protein [Lyngbya confervoides]|uniref:ROK family protein n=1 Tax=Lyngbya confervoides BDU141951 TaxID=1574623 RepID=A0ABD4T1T9_9CYAN|nr:ROK family protein [Lyngbya confervoides]MCM1982559.1 ROK family protein [Lyngbya confervoides BDU141951]
MAHQSPLKTLSIDIGGSGIKGMILDPEGQPVSDRQRVETPRPAEPDPVIDAIGTIAQGLGNFDRVSVGFPGVVMAGVVHTAVNLSPRWKGLDLATRLQDQLGQPTRVANDADIQGYGVIEGEGVELVVTLGTGFGSALFVDGKLVPNLEIPHHPFIKKKTYEQCLGRQALKKDGKQTWNRNLARAIATLEHTFNYRQLYIGGGESKRITLDLPKNVQIVSNRAGILGGIKLWDS